MSLVIRLLFVTLLSPAAMAQSQDQPWPGVPYSYVKGFFYFPMHNSDQSILRDGWLNASVEKIISVSEANVAGLRAAIVPIPKHPRTVTSRACYNPHHAFIFFDSIGRKPVAQVEICFECKKAYATPSLPDGTMWDFSALEALCRKFELPLNNDPKFKALAEAYSDAWSAREKRFAPHLHALEAAQEAKTSPPIEHAWPWVPYEKVRICLFNEEDWRPELVSFGKLNPSITKTIELTPEQQQRVWTAFTADREAHDVSPHVRMRIVNDGLRIAYLEGLNPIHNPPTDSKTLRRGLICFDAKDQPVAWLAFSEKDGNRLMQPADTDPPTLNSILWDPFKLGKIFDELGLPVPPPKEAGRD